MLNASKKIKGDMLTSTLASFGVLSLVLIIAFRSFRAFFCIMTPLLMGTIWTMGMMALFVGYMNLITAFIFAVLLGLGIQGVYTWLALELGSWAFLLDEPPLTVLKRRLARRRADPSGR